jgi:hypothetical protein
MSVKRFFWVCLVAIFATGCLPDDDNDPITQWVGDWSVRETTGEFAPQTYNVNISRRPSVMGDRVNIRGLYAQGNNFLIVADAFGLDLDIPEQEVSGLTISGAITLESNGDAAQISMQVNDGSGVDQISGEMTKL